jgi:hypothetical protein
MLDCVELGRTTAFTVAASAALRGAIAMPERWIRPNWLVALRRMLPLASRRRDAPVASKLQPIAQIVAKTGREPATPED